LFFEREGFDRVFGVLGRGVQGRDCITELSLALAEAWKCLQCWQWRVPQNWLATTALGLAVLGLAARGYVALGIGVLGFVALGFAALGLAALGLAAWGATLR
jgi:hypothetical protein